MHYEVLWKNRWLYAVATAIALLCPRVEAAGATVVYPAYEQPNEVRFHDLLDILQAALKITVPQFGPYALEPSSLGMNEARYMIELGKGESINIAWSSTSVTKETDFLPIRIPLRKGLLGYRVALIAKEKQAQIDAARTAEDLKKLMIGQGIGWGDVTLYRSNGFTVTESSYNDLFPQTTNGRVDLFPRGIGEVFDEFATHKERNPNLAIEKNLLIYYPWPYYFFFNKKDVALKNRIETGLRMMQKDGSFDALFRKHNDFAIKQANLKGRRIIRIQNDLLPPSTPMDPALWFDPTKY
jgi:hypothetical protein